MPILEWLEAWPGAVALKQSGTAYLFANAAHILGIGLLLGAILPLDLRLLGFFSSVPLPVIGPFLARLALFGGGLAIVTGFWLFTVKATEYVDNPAFLTKMGLLMLAVANAGLQHSGRAWTAAMHQGRVTPRVRVFAGASALLWVSVLIAGRWIGFV